MRIFENDYPADDVDQFENSNDFILEQGLGFHFPYHQSPKKNEFDPLPQLVEGRMELVVDGIDELLFFDILSDKHERAYWWRVAIGKQTFTAPEPQLLWLP